MSDHDKLEKVIKGLECCIPYESEENEHLCIYDDDYNQNCPYRGTGSYGASCMTKLMRDALALLKAQEPVEPVPAIDNDGDWLCGNCYQSVVWEEKLDAGGFVPVKFNFCPNCGRAVKWE